jgi:hypothetical protein
MRRIFSHRPSPAMIVALLALFIALGGVSYGVATIGTGDIKNRAVTTKKLKNGAVTTKKLKNGAVTTKKLRNRAVTGTKVKLDGLGGDVINESSLGKVPSAANADNATALDGPLASGKTLRGNFSVAGTNNPNGFVDESSISFAIPLASAPTFNVRTPGSPANAACPGTPEQPEAAPGNACFYETNLTNTTGALAFRNPGRFGVSFFTPATALGSYLARGRWAVTAP